MSVFIEMRNALEMKRTTFLEMHCVHCRLQFASLLEMRQAQIKMLDKLALFVILYLSIGNKEDGIT